MLLLAKLPVVALKERTLFSRSVQGPRMTTIEDPVVLMLRCEGAAMARDLAATQLGNPKWFPTALFVNLGELASSSCCLKRVAHHCAPSSPPQGQSAVSHSQPATWMPWAHCSGGQRRLLVLAVLLAGLCCAVPPAATASAPAVLPPTPTNVSSTAGLLAALQDPSVTSILLTGSGDR